MVSGTLIIRADGTLAIGHGHVMRCLALAQAWRERGGKCAFVMAELIPELQRCLSTSGFDIIPLTVVPGSSDDAAQLIQLARACDARWIVVDGYRFGIEYQRALKRAGERVLLIDDKGHTGSYCSDLVLDQNAGACEDDYVHREPATRILLGSRYAMLRSEFNRWRDWKREIPEVARRLLITMGGSDPENLTECVIRSISDCSIDNLEITVIAGMGNPQKKSLQSAAANSGANLRLLENATNMPELMSWADIALIAGGGTLWELLYMMCPVVSLARSPLQSQILLRLGRQGTLEFIESLHDFDGSHLASVISRLATSSVRRRNMAARGREMIDGRGAQRVCELMIGGKDLGCEFEDGARVLARS
jgi:UDP-2,4-diacetamido-2,4,6-trideoxy-beta-L-altropyranose hydrolase